MNFYKMMQRMHESTYQEYLARGYKEAYTEDMCFRKITDEEFNHIPFRVCEHSRYFCLPFIFLIGEVALVVGGLISSVNDIITSEEHGWLGVFLSLILGMFGISITLGVYKDRLDRIITPDSVVIAGEVVEVTRLRNCEPRHIVALHGVQKLITVRDHPALWTGTTVLVHKSAAGRYHLVEIPEDSVNFGLYPQNHTAELESKDPSGAYDYSKYEHVPLMCNEIKRISDEDYNELPRKFKTATPFGKGVFTLVWLVFTTITIGLIPFLIHSCVVHDAYFLPLCAAFICELMIQWIANVSVASKPFKREEIIAVDCIVLSKNVSSMDNRISLIDPERNLYSEAAVNNVFVNDIPLRVPVRLFICQGMVVHSKVL